MQYTTTYRINISPVSIASNVIIASFASIASILSFASIVSIATAVTLNLRLQYLRVQTKSDSHEN